MVVLPGAGGAHEGQLLAGLGKEADVVEDGLALLIGEVHMVEPHVAGELDEVVVLALDIPDRAQDGAVEGLAVLLVFPGPGLVFFQPRGLQLREGSRPPLPAQGPSPCQCCGGPSRPRGWCASRTPPVGGPLCHRTRLPASQCRGPPPAPRPSGRRIRSRAGQGHDDGVELLGDLVDGVGKALGQLQEAGNNAQGDGGVHPLRARAPPTIATITYWTLPMFTMIGIRMLA